jgi:hypothetical protein
MNEQELVFNVRELHVISLACARCGHEQYLILEQRTISKNRFPPGALYANWNWKLICKSS